MGMSIYVDKIFPIEGREDFFKYVVMNNGKLATGIN